MASILEIEDLEVDEDEGLMQFVGFGISKEHFGVNILTVQEIIRSTEVTTVPNSPSFVEGVINLRGDIIPVIDLRKRLCLFNPEKVDKRNWILILRIGNHVAGFIVDKVTKVLKVPEDSIDPPPSIVISGLENQYIQGVCEIDGKLLIVLDFESVLFNEEYYALKDMEYEEIRLVEEVDVA
ncbi:MAG: chemotaxis protein CheW [Gammaproteobacteria bacterium]|nr:MAG: chemotaxis protein CheW [Gammaproteobacteria bacterium]